MASNSATCFDGRRSRSESRRGSRTSTVDVDFPAYARIGLKDCLALRSGEKLAIIIDSETNSNLCTAVSDLARVEGARVAIYELEHVTDLDRCFLDTDAFFILSGRSLSYTPERLQANRRGARGISWNSMTTEQILRLTRYDYEKMERTCRTIAGKFESARNLSLKTRDGCTLTVCCGDRAAKQITGRAVSAGSFSQIGGVVGIAPIEGTASGTVRALGSVKLGRPHENLLNSPLDLVVKNGRISSISGERANDVRTYLAAYNDDDKTKQLGIVGLGLHSAARLCGQFGEDERVAGLVHLSFGINTYHGGTIEAKGRLDICLQPATLELDGKQLEETLWL